MWLVTSQSTYFIDDESNVKTEIPGDELVPAELVKFLENKLGIKGFDGILSCDTNTANIYFLSGGLQKPVESDDTNSDSEWYFI